MIRVRCRLLGNDKITISPYKSNANGQIERHKVKMANVTSNCFAENARTWETTLLYL